MSRRMITIERTFSAAIEDVWALWTTADGIESWWGPEGFRVKVRTLELRPGGALHYDMIAIGPDQIAFMKKAGMPLSQPTRATYKEVRPHTRLAFDCVVDFVPGVEPYETATVVELDGARRRHAPRADHRGDARRAVDADGGHGLGERAREAARRRWRRSRR